MEGLVDYVRRQVKCPECRAEHRIPYNGVQGFPSNVTLQRFLEAQIEITGETPDPHTGQFMERCAVCNEKNYLAVCAHCEKKVCEGCKAAHSEVLKREIGRINNQVKRAAHRLTEQLQNVERNITSLKTNTHSITEEIENISKRLQKAIRDREQYLLQEVQSQYNAEMRTMTHLKEGLDTEISNVQSNIELADKHMDDDTPWDDSELMDTKDIFLKTMEFIRSFDYDTGGDYGRKTRFLPPDDLNKLASSLSTMGELAVPSKHSDPYGAAQSFGAGGLAKSKSDHRLAVQFRDQEESSYGGRTSPVTRRRFGERPPPAESHDSAYESDTNRRRFRSRFIKREDEEDKGVRFTEDDSSKSQRVRSIDTEDVSRGPLSGIARIYDSPRVIQRLQERDLIIKKKKEDANKPAPPPAAAAAPKPATPAVNPYLSKKTARQVSEDEIDKIKKQNKAEETVASSSGGATAAVSTASSYSSPSSITSTRTPPERASTLHEDDRQSRSDRTSLSSRSSVPQSPAATADDDTSYPSSRRRDRDYTSSRATDYSTAGTANGTSRRTPSRKTSVDTGVVSLSQRAQPFSRSSSTSSIGESSKIGAARSSRTLDTASIERRLSRSNSTDSNRSYDGTTSPRKATGAAFSTDELKNRFGRTTTDTNSRSNSSTYPRTSSTSGSGSTRFQSRFLGRAGTPSVEASKESGNEDEDEESSEESESEDSEESSEDDAEEKEDKSSTYPRSGGGLLGRSAQNPSSSTSSSLRNKNTTDSGYASRYGSSSDNSSASAPNRYGTSINDTSSSSSYRRPSVLDNKKEEDHDPKYSFSSKYSSRNRAAPQEEETKPAFQSRFLNRSKSSAILGPDAAAAAKDDDSSSSMGAGRARFEEMKERRQRLARSKSSAGLDDDDASTTADSSPSTYKSKYSRDNDTSGTGSSSLGSRTLGSSSSSSPSGRDDGGSSTAQLSNWARYLKNKYGNKTSGDSTSGTTSSSSGVGGSSASPSSSLLSRTGVSSPSSSGAPSSSSISTARALARSRSSHLLGLAKDGESSEDDSSKNVDATPTSPAAAAGILVVPTTIGSIHRNQYLKKQHLLLQIGSRGSEPGNFTWPRGVAVGPDNSIVVADSSNHRVQVFDQNARFLKEFGSYGSSQGEFDCLAGVAVNRIGQYIIADRYNHRIQVFDPSGMFLRSFGSQGGGDGRFSYPWGVTTDALGFIYVCDKENHRVQVFQSDGTFVGKFGSLGSKPGQLEHPHYIAVSSTNRVIVSDSNNHRIQIFDINGKVQTTFGGEGAEEGQFKFPRGVAVDEQGYIIVADSGNNRIQVFQSDGTFLRAFGCWGSMDGEFKGLEGVAVMPNGNILVCDRENHRVQIF